MASPSNDPYPPRPSTPYRISTTTSTSTTYSPGVSDEAVNGDRGVERQQELPRLSRFRGTPVDSRDQAMLDNLHICVFGAEWQKVPRGIRCTSCPDTGVHFISQLDVWELSLRRPEVKVISLMEALCDEQDDHYLQNPTGRPSIPQQTSLSWAPSDHKLMTWTALRLLTSTMWYYRRYRLQALHHGFDAVEELDRRIQTGLGALGTCSAGALNQYGVNPLGVGWGPVTKGYRCSFCPGPEVHFVYDADIERLLQDPDYKPRVFRMSLTSPEVHQIVPEGNHGHHSPAGYE
ncbi:hypothetical protein LTR56_014866 [Elasticomyces elasticus]|nr:hypothetical protein LTR56_014866 [Elasticomyces elasticus]KAK3644676.1 hypothetical protein LTR22_015051 [Elasticomyces elasticus]KAK4916061.1 hypothetical protein LTR49_015835 [Elasticomyces elasticus]KAK5755199.1 hypothetical protein LTS12_014763 [Elasticomyces elasticus]